MILGNALARIPDKPHPPRGQIVKPAEIIRNLQGGGMGIERIDGEIASRGIIIECVRFIV